jgi:hypothetical protein
MGRLGTGVGQAEGSGFDRGLWKLPSLLADLFSSKAVDLSTERIPAVVADAPVDSSLGAKG